MGASLYKLCGPSAFGGKAGFAVDAQGVLAAPTSVRAVTGDGGAGFELGLSPAQWPLSGWDLFPSLQQKPGGLSASWPCSLDVCVFFCPHAGPRALESAECRSRRGLV